MKYVYVSSSILGKTWLYEEIGPSGGKRLVPTYRAEMGDESNGQAFHFRVTRDSAAVVFRGLKQRYALAGECPPNAACKPYYGRLRPLPRNGLSLLLWETGLGNHHSVRGVSKTVRSSILIHRGPASSLGCMAIAGGALGYRRWLRAARAILPLENDVVRVFIEPRPESHHTIHLSR